MEKLSQDKNGVELVVQQHTIKVNAGESVNIVKEEDTGKNFVARILKN